MTFPPKVNVLLTPGAGKGTMKLTSFLEEMSMAKIVKKSPAPLYLAAAVWAAWAVLAPPVCLVAFCAGGGGLGGRMAGGAEALSRQGADPA